MEIGRPRIKICGMTRPEDALFAVRAGVDALGFIFYHKSPRCVELNAAKDIIKSLPPFVDKVGVFVNASIDEVVQVASIGLTAIQLHGNESPDYCRELQDRLLSCSLIKAFRVGSESRGEDFSGYNSVVDAFLLDTYVKGAKGGTGEVFDWQVIEQLHLQRPVLLAGGLEPDNIELAIRSTGSYCYDVNSGVEVAPGVKDHLKIERLMSIVKRVNTP
ncbi:MAG: phosphoribosylanthranilate isomerase [Desulforhopalus sp.]|jgi:phosphoribosylanthranilate isomerase